MQTLKNLFLFIFCFLKLSLSGQITDDFSDGNLTQAPVWAGDVSHFAVDAAGLLQLQAPAAGVSVIVTQGNIPDSAVWSIDVRLDFAPSTANLLRIYLTADQPDLAAAAGYLLEIGETGNMDALRFLRQDAGVRTLLASGTPGAVAGEPVDIRLRVRRSASGDWTVEMAAGSAPFAVQCTANDLTYAPGPDRFFGLYCVYTSTRTDKFFFDNISVLPDLPDVQAPVLQQIRVNNALELEAVFDEMLDTVSAAQRSNYQIPGIGIPAAAKVQPDGRTVRLTLPVSLQTGNYTLICSGVKDAAGNIAALQTKAFSFVLIEAAGLFDILINEIMADPSPSAGLPEAEWLELYNRSAKIIDLKTLVLSDGGAPQPLPDILLQPDSFVALCSNSALAAMNAIAPNVRSMSSFPGLNNDGETLTLSTANGEVIDQLRYEPEWHSSAAKQEGGWTLERINPETPCLGAENWQSCPVTPGGTPGRRNAAFKDDPDAEPPRLIAAFPQSPTTVRVQFSEGLDASSAANPAAYRLTPPLTIAGAQQAADDRAVVWLQLESPLQNGQVYRLSVTDALTDCSGNVAPEQDTLQIGLPEIPNAQDVVLNEILFNPASGGFRYLEFYNRSNKIFNWQDFFIANFFEGTDIKPVGLQRLFLPGEYVVFTENPADILLRFPDADPERLVKTDLPSIGDDEDNITLYRSDGSLSVTLDSFQYDAGFHNPFFSSADREGVSLERIRADGPTNDPDNWTSAAGPAGGPAGTPTRPNSQSRPSAPTGGAALILLRERLSPDDDGYEDFLEMQYRLPDTDFAATITIYDAGGIPVKRIVRQALSGTEGVLRWNGDAEDGQRVRPGIYVVYAEFFEPAGQVIRVKKPVSVVRRF